MTTRRPRYVFERPSPETFQPSKYAAGPYAGLQGGAIAAIAATTMESKAPPGFAPLSFHIEFLRPAPLELLRVHTETLHTGRRVHRYTATVSATHPRPVAVAQATMTLILAEPITRLDPPTPVPDLPPATAAPYKRATRPHPWMMDIFDAVAHDDTTWFRWRCPLAPGATAFAHLLGPADWAHGIPITAHRDRSPVTGWPNINMSVQVARLPVGDWLGMRAYTVWDRRGAACGGARLLDAAGELGDVAMGVVLTQDRQSTTPHPSRPPVPRYPAQQP